MFSFVIPFTMFGIPGALQTNGLSAMTVTRMWFHQPVGHIHQNYGPHWWGTLLLWIAYVVVSIQHKRAMASPKEQSQPAAEQAQAEPEQDNRAYWDMSKNLDQIVVEQKRDDDYEREFAQIVSQFEKDDEK